MRKRPITGSLVNTASAFADEASGPDPTPANNTDTDTDLLVAASTAYRSALEVAFLALCRDHGLPRPEVNVMVAGRLRDFYWPAHGLVVETDGRASHLTPLAFEDDRERDTLLQEAGYKVRRFTYRQITERPAWVAARLRMALAA